MSSPSIEPQPVGPAPSTPAAASPPEAGKGDIPAISRGRAVRFGAGFLIFGLLWAVGLATIAMVLLPQRLTVIGASSPAALLGTFNAVTAVASLVANLLFGNLSDRSRPRFGRRTPWIVGGGILAGITLFLMGVLESPVLIGISYCLAMFGLNMMLAPAVAIISDRIPLVNRGTMSAFFGAGATAGYPLGALVGAQFIHSLVPGFVVAGIAMAAAGIVSVLIWPREGSARSIPHTDTGTIKDLVVSFQPPRHAPDFYKAFVGRLFMLLSYQMVSAYQLYILENYIRLSTTKAAEAISTISIITLVVSLAASIAAGPISDRLKRRKVPVIAASILFAVGIAMPWIFPSVTGMFLYAAIAGLGYGVYSSVDQALNVDVLPNKEQAGKDLGILNLATTLGQMLGPVITSALVVATGGYHLVFPIAIASAVIGAVVIVWIRKVR